MGSPLDHSGTPPLQLEWFPSAGLRISGLVPCGVITRRRSQKKHFPFSKISGWVCTGDGEKAAFAVREEDRPRFRRLLSPWFFHHPVCLSRQQKPTSAFTRLNPRGCLTPGISIYFNKNRPNSGHSQKIIPTFSSKLAMGTDILKN